jgi:hypothetical protein
MVGTVRVINKATTQARLPEVAVYVGRPTALGNPFRIMTESQRGMMVDRYEPWLLARLAHKDNVAKTAFLELVERVRRGEHLALACTCAPRRCHADIIKKHIEIYLEKDNAPS